MGLLHTVAFAGGEWVIWALVAGSVLAGAIVMERAAAYRRDGVLLERQARAFEAAVGAGAPPPPGLFARRLAAAREGARAAAAARIRDRIELERGLAVLGTLGTLSPFIGLFGTVLGIIRAFRDLAQVGAGHPEIVMQGIAEALVATAAGIFVAMLCVAAYNFFSRRLKEALAEAERFELLHGQGERRG